MTTSATLLGLDLGDNQLLRVDLEDTRPLGAHQSPGSAFAAAVDRAVSVPFNTNGWDTTYAIRLTDVNRAIAAKGTSPTSWSASIPASMFGPRIDGTGTFGTWSLTNGAGSGATIRMHIPFAATVTANGTSLDVAGGLAYVLVKLTYLPQPPNTPGRKSLVVRTQGGSPDDPVVSVSSVTYTSPAQNSGLDNALVELLQQWFNANLSSFEHVFATVNLGMEGASGAFQWLYPTHSAYAYIDGATLDDSLLGVLCMTESRDITGTVQELAAGAIPDAARAGFSISPERFLDKMVLPSLVAEFPQVPSTTFQLSNNNTEIDATGSVTLPAVNVAGVNYTPEMTTFRVTVNNDQLVTYAYIHIPISPGIDAYAEFTYTVAIVLGTKSDGTQSLTYQEVSPAVKHTWYTIAPWVQGVEIAASVILAIIAAAVTYGAASITSVVARVIVALIVGGVIGAIVSILEKIPEWIAGSVPDALPSVDALVLNATASTVWADGKDFGLTNVLLNNALQFGGNPGFPAA
jgi:hypothetical protein